MKNIKLRIVYLILGSALLLFALFVLAVNVISPSHFVNEAKRRCSTKRNIRIEPFPTSMTNRTMMRPPSSEA